MDFQTDSGHFQCELPVDDNELNRIMSDVKRVLNGIISDRNYSKEIEIPLGSSERHLRSIADLNLFNRIFLGFDRLIRGNPIYK